MAFYLFMPIAGSLEDILQNLVRHLSGGGGGSRLGGVAKDGT